MPNPLSINSYIFISDARFSVDTVKQRNIDTWNLHIRAVSLYDQGNYTCQVTAKTVMSRTVQLMAASKFRIFSF